MPKPACREEMSESTAHGSTHYAFETLEDGVSFGRARPQGTGLSNTGVIDLGGATVVFDTSLTLHSAREIRAASVALTGRPPSFAVNSHRHLDHLLGNQVFADRPIYATRRTIERVLQLRAEMEQELTPAKLDAEIRELEERQRAQSTDGGRAEYDEPLRFHRMLRTEAAEIRLTPPSDGFDGELRLPGDLGASLLTYGGGHSESDALLWLPKSRILFAGDLLVADNHPNLASGDLPTWLEILDRIDELHPERIGTGHGPLGTPETIEVARDYLTAVREAARESKDVEIPARFRSWAMAESFEQNVASVRERMKTPPG